MQSSTRQLFTLAVFAMISATLLSGCGTYNDIVALDEGVTRAAADVETQLQRRNDLIPNLVASVQKVADQEKEVLTAVTEARARASSMQFSGDVLTDPAAMEAFRKNESTLRSALSRLMVTVEKYPDLKSSEAFMNFNAQLEGTENRIAVARTRYNDAVAQYNTRIRQIPGNLLASMFSFKPRVPFEADEGAKAVPKVEFR